MAQRSTTHTTAAVFRGVVTPQELPIGVITALIGGPILVVLIRRRAYRQGAGT